MYSEFANDEHRAQGEELLLELGRFAVAFERVCEGMRHAIMLVFQSEGLQHQGLARVVIGDKTSGELQVLLGALVSELRTRTDDADQEAIHALLKEVNKLTEARNVVIHSAWSLGQNAAVAELYATAIRPRTKQNKGAVPEIHGMSAQYLRQLTETSNALQIRLQRLQNCIIQNDLKVATELSRAL
ncbi:MAG: hypothetical protein JNK03_09570 [Nitrospira sp.]|jgi:hypothetical protein|nr:hypothetical protein [Nitrospira sp.]